MVKSLQLLKNYEQVQEEGRSQKDQLSWELQDCVENYAQLQLRHELIAIRTLSTMVGAGQSKA